LTTTAFDPLPLPRGVPVPICFFGDPWKVTKSDEEDTYEQRYSMCANYAFDPMIAQHRINLMVRIICQTFIGFHMK
jgi:hypothetical protein